MSAILSRTMKTLLLALMLVNITGALFSDGFVPMKLADKRAPTIFFDAEGEKFANTPAEQQLVALPLSPQVIPIIAIAVHRPFPITRLPKATGPPAA